MIKNLPAAPREVVDITRYQKAANVQKLYREAAPQQAEHHETYRVIGIAHKLFSDMSSLARVNDVADWLSVQLGLPTTTGDVVNRKISVREAALPRMFEQGHGYAIVLAHTLDYVAREQGSQA